MYELDMDWQNKFGTTGFFKSGDREKIRMMDEEIGKSFGAWHNGEWYDYTKELDDILSKSKSHKKFTSNIRRRFKETEKPILECLVEKAKLGNALLQKNHDYLKAEIFPKISKEIITLP